MYLKYQDLIKQDITGRFEGVTKGWDTPGL